MDICTQKLKIPDNFWPYLQYSLDVILLLLDHWNAGKHAGTVPTDGEHNVPNLLVNAGLMDQLISLQEDIPNSLLNNELSQTARKCMHLLLKSDSTICLFTIQHFIEQSQATQSQASDPSQRSSDHVDDFLVLLACEAMQDSKFFTQNMSEETNGLDTTSSSASAAGIRNVTLGREQKIYLGIFRKLLKLFQVCGGNQRVQKKVSETVKALFDQEQCTISVYVAIFATYGSSASLAAAIDRRRRGANNTSDQKLRIPVLLESDILKCLSGIQYWRFDETPHVQTLTALLVDRIRESLEEEFVDLIIGVLVHLTNCDTSAERLVLASLLGALAAACTLNEAKRKALEEGTISQFDEDASVLTMTFEKKKKKENEGLGGIGLLDDENDAEEQKGERQDAVSFLMKVIQRFPNSQRIMSKGQYLLSLSLDY